MTGQTDGALMLMERALVARDPLELALAGFADPRTTRLYDMAKNNKDRHASHRVASFLASMTG